MARSPIPIPLGFYQSESLPFSAQRCINWIPVIPQGEALNNRALMMRPGLKQFADTELGACRGAWVFNEVPYFVNGNSLTSISSTGVVTNHGTISGTVRVSMASNKSFLVIAVPGGDAYAFDGTDLTKITDPDFKPSDSVVFKDGFFVFSASDGNSFFHSAINDPFSYNALDFGSAEVSDDRIVSLHINHNELYALGTLTVEVFQNVGGTGFVFQRIPGANITRGSASKYGTVNFDGSFVFMGGGVNEDVAIWRVVGSSQAQKISTDAIDNAIQMFNKEEIESAFSTTYSEKGQLFAIFTLNSNRIPGRTFVYNGTATALAGNHVWFELQSGLTDAPWRCNAIVKACGKILCGDASTGLIGELDKNTFDEYGAPIFQQAATAPFSQNGTAIFAGELEATFEAGVGLTVGQGSNPVIRMDFSDDGGRTWSNEFKRFLGKIGEFGHAAIWRRQGRFPDQRVIRLTKTDPVKGNLIRLAATPQLGSGN